MAPKTQTAKVDDATDQKTETTRVAPLITTISKEIPMPEKKGRGSKSLYPFDDLEVGASFGVKNKTASGMASIVSNQNRLNRVVKKDENGNTVFKTKELKGADGTKTHVPTDKPEMIGTKRFVCSDVDPKTDPDGATVRVWRQS